METLSRRKLVSSIRQKTGFRKQAQRGKFINKVLNATIDCIMEHLIGGGNVKLKRFGTLELKTCKATVGRTKAVGRKHGFEHDVEVVIPAHKKVVFKPSAQLKAAVKRLPV